VSEVSRTDAVVLRTMKYRDTSLIVTLLTREFGKVSGIIKGARKTRSGYGSAVQPMARVQAMIYRKEGRELQTIGTCDIIEDFRHVQEELPKMAVGMKMVELAQMISHEEQNEPLFELLVAGLAALDAAPGSAEQLFAWFEVSLCAILGFGLTFHECVECGRKKSPTGPAASRLQFHLERGGVLCDACAGPAGEKISVRRRAIDLLDLMAQEADPARAMALAVSPEELADMESLLWSFLRHHVAGVRPLKSERVFSRILPDS
jgi:DNA repair protein RecO (recombination protein O)